MPIVRTPLHCQRANVEDRFTKVNMLDYAVGHPREPGVAAADYVSANEYTTPFNCLRE